MLPDRRQRLKITLTVLSVILIWSAVLIFVSPIEIVHRFGIQNDYLAGFIIASFGGVSTFTSASYFTAVTALAELGKNVFLIMIIMGTGVTIGDSVFFWLGKTGRKSLPKYAESYVADFLKWCYGRPSWTVSLICFLYAGFAPLPNDVLTVSTGAAEFSFERVMPFVWLGNMVFAGLLAVVATSWY